MKVMQRFLVLSAAAASALVAGCAAGGPPASEPNAARVVGQFQANNGGVHAGYRVNHAKGVCVAGYFEGNGAALPYSRAQLFQKDLRTPVIGRFSIPGGNPQAADGSVPVRGLGLSFMLPDGEQWRTAMINAPVFQIRTPEAFFTLLKLRERNPATGQPDQEKLAAFLAAHPDTQPFMHWAKSTRPSTSFATLTYNSLDAFELVAAQGAKTAVRWSFVPAAETRAATGAHGAEDLAHDLRQRLGQGPLKWRLIFTLAAQGDPIDDSTRAWPEARTKVDAGTLMLHQSSPQATGACRDIDFNPLTLPRGIEPSGDPMIRFRADVYRAAWGRRTQQEQQAQK